MARDFDGIDDYINIGTNTAIDSFTNLSFACWAVREGGLSSSGSRFSSVANGGTHSFRMQAVTDNKPTFIITDAADRVVKATTAMTQDVLYHVACIYDGTTMRIYVDGTEENSGTEVSGNLDLSGATIRIGNRFVGGTNRPWNGRLSECGFWNRGLSAAEVTILSKGYSPLFIPKDLEIYLPLIGRTSPEIELIGGDSGTVSGAVVGVHPRIIYPTSQQIRRYGSTAAANTRRYTLPVLGIG